ncbi:MAG TPA: phenylalanine--tRNA ligase beta subunit-related protein [Myxococcota bacterium]|nr:phenylalanine--tRNA ligase beta subunit-related protein [Myxococcota bacterium]
MLAFDPHPLLDAATLVCTLPRPLSSMPSPQALVDLLALDAPAPLTRDEELRTHVRKLLRHGGFKPSGRNKPASEYLVKAAEAGFLGSINAAVDACNAVSLHSGLPITVVDLDRTRGGLRVGIVEAGSYVFNASGQELKLDGLLCLHDAEGPCGNAVKDSQRTKTHDDTTTTLSVIWGTNAVPGRARAAADWYGELLRGLGAVVV